MADVVWGIREMDMEAERAGCDKKLEECIQYFRQRPVYHKLFVKVWDKYQSLGHFGGTVRLTGLTQEECGLLGGFFQRDFWGKEPVSISAAAMEKALGNSRFSGLSWEKILQGYFQKELVGKKEQRLQEDMRRDRFYAGILDAAPAGPGRVWLEETLRTKGEGYLLLRKQYREQPHKLEENLRLLMRAIPRLPFLSAGENQEGCELLAVFAAETTGDPHFFDAGTPGEQLLTAFLKQKLSEPLGREDSQGKTAVIPDTEVQNGLLQGETAVILDTEVQNGLLQGETAWVPDIEGQNGLFTVEGKARLFYEAGLLRDELSNNTLVYGITGVGKDGEPHEGISGFLKRREPLQLTLMTMRKLARVCPQKEKRVYIVENPAVFSKLMKAWPEASIVCGNGQIRLAALVLLDLFDAETAFLYAGDYDPEGLQIAQRLKERYGERLQLWKYSREFYERYQSDVEVSERSLKKLAHISLPELQEIKQAMLQKKKAAYQEAMLEEYLRKV